jgi:hypothetical protein
MVGAKFANRKKFTLSLKRWATGSFGDSKRLHIDHDNGSTVYYKCTKCNEDKFNCVLQIHRRRQEQDGKLRIKGKNCPVEILEWNRCSCRISEEKETDTIARNSTFTTLGQIFESRHEFTNGLREYCECNRKMMFRAIDKGNKLVRSCQKEGCPGMVEVSLAMIKKRGGHTWGPPLTITKFIQCNPGCREECGEKTALCCLCQNELPLSQHCGFTCCSSMKNSSCLPCITKYLQSRPTHSSRWPGNRSLLNKVVRVGMGYKDVFFCCLFKCEWTMDQTYSYNGDMICIKDKMLVGFNGDDAVWDPVLFDTLLREHSANVLANPMLNAVDTTETVMAEQLRIQNDQLRDVTGSSASTRNHIRIRMVVDNRLAITNASAVAYLNRYDLFEEQRGSANPVIID